MVYHSPSLYYWMEFFLLSLFLCKLENKSLIPQFSEESVGAVSASVKVLPSLAVVISVDQFLKKMN